MDFHKEGFFDGLLLCNPFSAELLTISGHDLNSKKHDRKAGALSNKMF